MLRHIYFCMLLCLCALPAWAQLELNPKRIFNNNKAVFDGNRVLHEFLLDSSQVQELLGEFWKTRSPYFRNSKTPTFNFVAPNGRFYMGIGGFVNYSASFDFAGISQGPYFSPYFIPVPQTSYNKAQLQSNAWATTIDFRVVQKVGKHAIVGYINGQYVGGNTGNFILHEGWLSYRGWLFGYNFSTFDDVQAEAPTISLNGMNGTTKQQNALIRFTRQLNARWRLAIGVEQPSFSQPDYSLPAGQERMLQRMPDIPAYVQYGNPEGNRYLRLSGLVRNLAYWNAQRQEQRSLFAWGGQVSGVYAFSKHLQCYYQFAGGRGIGQYVQDLLGNGYDVYATQDGKLQTLPVWAGYLTLQYNISPQVFCTASYSQVRIYADGHMGPTDYKTAYMGTANVFWHFLPNAQVALEYNLGRRSNQDGMHSHANRVYVMTQYNF